jgi:hypothetical protein
MVFCMKARCGVTARRVFASFLIGGSADLPPESLGREGCKPNSRLPRAPRLLARPAARASAPISTPLASFAPSRARAFAAPT